MSRLIALLILSGLFLSSPAFAFYCGHRLVHEGDTRGEVRAKCGEPEDVATRSVLRRPVVFIRGRPVYSSFDLVEVPIETWTYNFGPNKLMRRLRFEDGRLVDIETLSYGYLPRN